MSAEIVAVLVVPMEGDPGGLLADGIACGRPPRFCRERNTPVCRECGAPGKWSPAPTEQTDSHWICSVEWRHNGIDLVGWSGWMATSSRRDGCERALPLWWDGALAPEGWDRARRVICDQGWTSRPSLLPGAWRMDPACSGVLMLADELVARNVASRVVRLTRDLDGQLVEVP